VGDGGCGQDATMAAGTGLFRCQAVAPGISSGGELRISLVYGFLLSCCRLAYPFVEVVRFGGLRKHLVKDTNGRIKKEANVQIWILFIP